MRADLKELKTLAKSIGWTVKRYGKRDHLYTVDKDRTDSYTASYWYAKADMLRHGAKMGG